MTKSRRVSARAGATPRTRASRKRGSFHRWLAASVGILLGALASLGLFLSIWSRWSSSNPPGWRLVRLEEPLDAGTASESLVQAGLVRSSWLMSTYLSTLGRFGEIEPGPHLLPIHASPRILSLCLARSVQRPEAEVVIPEGFDHVRVAQRLEQAGISPVRAFVDAVRSRELLDRHGIRSRDGQGYLFPATYRLHVDSTPQLVLSRFVNETRSRLNRLAAKIGPEPFQTLSARRNWGESEILTLASIVEKEARVDDERPIIAGVFFNRLDSETFRPRRMLQSDPTAGYGCLVLRDSIPSCRDYQQRILPAMLRDAANPYNTYRHPGLPPGAIASPGEASIAAVLKPVTTDYLFFVATGDGRHRFSSSFEEHETNIRGTPQ